MSDKTLINNLKTEGPKHGGDWPNDAGFNASVEVRKPKELVVQGRIPPAVAGTLYRTGPGHYQIPDTPIGTYKAKHWFDGFSHIHRFEMIPSSKDSCKVLYNSRRQIDPRLDEIRKTGKLDQFTFAQKMDPCAGFFGKLKSAFFSSESQDPYFHNVGVTLSSNPSGLAPQPNAMVVKTDASIMKEIDSATLEPLSLVTQEKLHPDLKGPLSCAHPEYDPETGDMFNYNLDFGLARTYRVFKSSLATGKTEILATISDKTIPGAYIHSFFLTSDYVVLAVWCSHIIGTGIKIMWEKNVLDTISPLDPKSKVKWLVIDRKHGRGHVASFDSPPRFCFHTINAWQEPASDGSESVDIYCDLIEYKSTDILHKLYYENLVSTGLGVSKSATPEERAKDMDMARYRLANIPTGAIHKSPKTNPGKAELLFGIAAPKIGELPTINPSFSTKKARYVYSVVDRGYSSWVDGIGKLDLDTKEAVYWTAKRHTPGEPIFVADNTRECEDAGYLLSVVLDGDKGTSYLLCLDARTMEEIGRAECEVPVGIGFHGSHVAPKD